MATVTQQRRADIFQWLVSAGYDPSTKEHKRLQFAEIRRRLSDQLGFREETIEQHLRVVLRLPNVWEQRPGLYWIVDAPLPPECGGEEWSAEQREEVEMLIESLQFGLEEQRRAREAEDKAREEEARKRYAAEAKAAAEARASQAPRPPPEVTKPAAPPPPPVAIPRAAPPPRPLQDWSRYAAEIAKLHSGFKQRTSQFTKPLNEPMFVKLATAVGISEGDALSVIIDLGRQGHWRPRILGAGNVVWESGFLPTEKWEAHRDGR